MEDLDTLGGTLLLHQGKFPVWFGTDSSEPGFVHPALFQG